MTKNKKKKKRGEQTAQGCESFYVEASAVEENIVKLDRGILLGSLAALLEEEAIRLAPTQRNTKPLATESHVRCLT